MNTSQTNVLVFGKFTSLAFYGSLSLSAASVVAMLYLSVESHVSSFVFFFIIKSSSVITLDALLLSLP